MFKKKQILIIVSVALISFLLGTVANVSTVPPEGKGKPKDDVWEAIDALNQTVEDLKTQLEEPQVITVTGHQNWTQLTTGVWTDLLSIPDITVSEGTNVLAIASGSFNCSEVTQASLRLRHRVNETHGQYTCQGFTGKIEMNWIYGAAKESIEIHHVWTDLSAGTYTFGIQYYVCVPREIQVQYSRLTVIIF